jgi:hypothetical protein
VRLRSETLAEFREVRACIAARLDLCIGLDDEFAGWIRFALTESRMSIESRVRLLDQLALQQERQGDIDGALAALRKASALKPSDTYYPLRELLLIAEQGQVDEAERLLQGIEQRERKTRVDRRGIRRTRDRLDALRGNEQAIQPEVAAEPAS